MQVGKYEEMVCFDGTLHWIQDLERAKSPCFGIGKAKWSMDWKEASNYCKANGGQLPTPTDDDKRLLISTLTNITSEKEVHLGFFNEKGTWMQIRDGQKNISDMKDIKPSLEIVKAKLVGNEIVYKAGLKKDKLNAVLCEHRYSALSVIEKQECDDGFVLLAINNASKCYLYHEFSNPSMDASDFEAVSSYCESQNAELFRPIDLGDFGIMQRIGQVIGFASMYPSGTNHPQYGYINQKVKKAEEEPITAAGYKFSAVGMNVTTSKSNKKALCFMMEVPSTSQPMKKEKDFDILGTQDVIITDLEPEITMKEIDDLSYLGVAPEAKRTTESNSRSSYTSQKTISPMICLASNCFSLFDEGYSRRLNWKYCESQFCCRQLSAVRLECLPCKHNICSTCMEEYKQLLIPVCPAEECSAKAFEASEPKLCDGLCKRQLQEGEYTTTNCCQARICFDCFETLSGREYSPDVEKRCPTTECLKHSNTARCQAGLNCKNLTVSGFPSKNECEHAICMQCLEKMIDDCDSVGSLPRCPNGSCSALYSTESVIAMRAMLPGKSAFFNKLSLDNNYCYTIKDETVTPIKFSSNFKSMQRCFEIDVKLSDGSESKKLLFDRIGTIADLVREIRRELNIAPEEKVYGYYLTRSINGEEPDDDSYSGKPDDDNYSDKPAKKLELSGESINETVEKLSLSSAITIVADIAGIVQIKNDIASSDTGI